MHGFNPVGNRLPDRILRTGTPPSPFEQLPTAQAAPKLAAKYIIYFHSSMSEVWNDPI